MNGSKIRPVIVAETSMARNAERPGPNASLGSSMPSGAADTAKMRCGARQTQLSSRRAAMRNIPRYRRTRSHTMPAASVSNPARAAETMLSTRTPAASTDG
jgi:hypothetical protein